MHSFGCMSSCPEDGLSSPKTVSGRQGILGRKRENKQWYTSARKPNDTFDKVLVCSERQLCVNTESSLELESKDRFFASVLRTRRQKQFTLSSCSIDVLSLRFRSVLSFKLYVSSSLGCLKLSVCVFTSSCFANFRYKSEFNKHFNLI